ncbi:MAG: hypothetical protein J6R92_01910 [Akkermansia sp.]|nr:hypothetical protein [Akkermansia sp.]
MITFYLIAIILHYLVIYLAYLPVSRKDVSQGKMHITSLKVAGLSFLTGIIAGFVGISSSVGVPITALIIYHMGRSQLLQSRKQAWASAGIYIGLSILLAAFFAYLMVTNESFRIMILQIME